MLLFLPFRKIGIAPSVLISADIKPRAPQHHGNSKTIVNLTIKYNNIYVTTGSFLSLSSTASFLKVFNKVQVQLSMLPFLFLFFNVAILLKKMHFTQNKCDTTAMDRRFVSVWTETETEIREI